MTSPAQNPIPRPMALHILESLRGDAFVMEANAHGDPAITDSDAAFELVFERFYQQLLAMFDSPPIAVLAIDSCGQTKREVMVALKRHHDPRPEVVRGKTTPTTYLGGLAHANDPAAYAIQFASEFCPRVSELETITNSQRIIVAPYLVRSVEPAPPTEYEQQLKTWKKTVGSFMYTRAFENGTHAIPTEFANPYYASALLLFLPQSQLACEEECDWIEALHLMFQMSWGFPTLGSTKRHRDEIAEHERQTLEHLQIVENNRRELLRHNNLMRFIEKPARELAEQVRKLGDAAGAIQRVLAPVDQHLFRDLERGAVFFDDVLSEKVEVDDGVTIRPAHGWGDTDSKDPKFIPAVLTRILDLHGKGYFTKDNLTVRAEHLVRDGHDFRQQHLATGEALRRILGLRSLRKKDLKQDTY